MILHQVMINENIFKTQYDLVNHSFKAEWTVHLQYAASGDLDIRHPETPPTASLTEGDSETFHVSGKAVEDYLTSFESQ